MLACVHSASVLGIDALPVEIEVDVANGLPGIVVVGLPDTAIKESRDRIKAAIKNSQLTFPLRRITVNLAPADTRKEGPAFDLPIAVGLLAASEQLSLARLADMVVVGELALDGRIRPVRGILAVALAVRAHTPTRLLLVPAENAAEAAAVRGLRAHAVSHLRQVVDFLNGSAVLDPLDGRPLPTVPAPLDGEDFSEVKGQAQAKRALEVAVAGGHNLLMIGPPGAGKTMLARRVPTILPPPSLDEALEITQIHSVAGLLPPQAGLLHARPFRSPHHTASAIALIGGGTMPRPGEVSLAHHGVLFLDELPEFPRHALEVLRQPLEDGRVTISRAAQALTFPCQFLLLAAMNPCPCGHLGQSRTICRCTPVQVQQYRGRLSGPLLDRIDLHVEVPPITYPDLANDAAAEPSAAIRGRVVAARARQARRFHGRRVSINARIPPKELSRWCAVDDAGRQLLHQAFTRFGISARAYSRVLRVARTIADLAGHDAVRPEHLAEAIQYRSLDRQGWG